jgi:hypothetical protein
VDGGSSSTLSASHGPVRRRRAVDWLLGGFFAYYDPTRVPEFATRLRPPSGGSVLVVKGWFALSGFMRPPWHFVEVWCDETYVDSVCQGIGRVSRTVTPLAPGRHKVKLVGENIRKGTRTVVSKTYLDTQPGSVTYLAFVPPRPNIIQTPKPTAKWFLTSWDT